MKPVVNILTCFLFILFAFSEKSFAWGNRGHHTLCEAATYLVKDKNLQHFMRARSHTMGHLCNIPDIYWRALEPAQTSVGNSTHYIDIEITGLEISKVPADYRSLIKTFEGTDNKMKVGQKIKSIPSEFGSMWWRADQFFRRATLAGQDIGAAAPPKNFSEQQDQKLKFNESVYNFFVNLGLMGHFVGDASMPYHATFDYDGYGTGHGGVHTYYEDEGVDAQDAKLVFEIVEAAKKLQSANKKPSFLTSEGVIEKMRALSIVSVQDIAKVAAIDPVTKESKVEKAEGRDLRVPAERKPITTVASKFKTLLISEMARSAALLALLWDEAYEKIGRPDLSLYRSYQYPFTPNFVPPDYYDLKVE